MVHGGESGLARDPLVGQVLSQRYRILAKLGEGAMAGVYLAEHTGVGATIVLKVLLPELAGEPQVVESFLREARIAAEIRHDNVIDIFYSGRSPEGHVFLAMEYVNGSTLYDVLAKDGALPWPRAKPILIQIAGALAAAHKQGVIHRDIKPENVLVGSMDTPDGPAPNIKVVDFGIANTRGDEASVCGTPEFMPPEQAQGLPPDPRDDIYAFGCLMYQVLTGDVPFRDTDMPKVLLMHLRDPVVPPRQRRPDLAIPGAAQEIVMRALEKKRADRWQDMGEVERLLEQIEVLPEEIPAPPEPLPPRIELAVVPPPPAPVPPPPLAVPLEQRRARARARLPMILAGALILGACAIAFVRHAMLSSPGRLELVTEPADAEIFIDGHKMADRSPMFLDASPGSYTVVVRSPGYETLTRVLVMKPRAAEQVPLVLTALPVPKAPPAPRPRPAAEPVKRHAAPTPPVTGVTFIDFKKAAAEQQKQK